MIALSNQCSCGLVSSVLEEMVWGLQSGFGVLLTLLSASAADLENPRNSFIQENVKCFHNSYFINNSAVLDIACAIPS